VLGACSHGDWRRNWVIMVTAGHMACGAVTAMRWLTSALSYRCRQEDASRHHSVGRGCLDRDVGRCFGAPGHAHAAPDHASGRWHGAPGARCGGGGCRIRPRRTGGFRVHSRPGGFPSGGPQEIGPESDECVFAGRPARYARAGPPPWAPSPPIPSRLRNLANRRNWGKPGRPGTRTDAGPTHRPGLP
jgi:hypothetical protein